jgi:hypothetical protein
MITLTVVDYTPLMITLTLVDYTPLMITLTLVDYTPLMITLTVVDYTPLMITVKPYIGEISSLTEICRNMQIFHFFTIFHRN